MALAVGIVLALAGVPALFFAGYLFWLSLLSRKPRAQVYGEAKKRFDVIVPAHDEEAAIASTVAGILAVDYPAALRRVIVVADNCSDATAARAEAAGATVLVRVDKELRGKGYALAHAFEHSLRDGFADAVVVVDADTAVSPNLLAAFAHRFEHGARAAQAEYGVSNPNASWRTRLMVIALALFHALRSSARERLGLSAGLRGNGMAFSKELIREIPHEAFSIVEDLEYGIRLGYAGYRVHYAAEAHVYGEMVSSEKASRSQRERWEGGRFAMAKLHGLPLIRAGLKKRSGLLFDLGMDVLVPPLTYLVAGAIGGLAVSSVWAIMYPRAWWSIVPWGLSLGFLAFYVLRGWLLSGVGPRGILDLMWAPVYVVWKIGLALRGAKNKKGEWVRTTREGEQPRI
jgi:1,2-diacylglycerol 3-beta-glucosyltransferase